MICFNLKKGNIIKKGQIKLRAFLLGIMAVKNNEPLSPLQNSCFSQFLTENYGVMQLKDLVSIFNRGVAYKKITNHI